MTKGITLMYKWDVLEGVIEIHSLNSEKESTGMICKPIKKKIIESWSKTGPYPSAPIGVYAVHKIVSESKQFPGTHINIYNDELQKEGISLTYNTHHIISRYGKLGNINGEISYLKLMEE